MRYRIYYRTPAMDGSPAAGDAWCYDGDTIAVDASDTVTFVRVEPEPRKAALARNAWTREQESRTCRACRAVPGQQCVTASGTGAPWPHMARFDDAVAAEKKPGED